MDEDWGDSANAPVFNLFKDVSPEEEAAKDGFVDQILYNRWKKHERRIYKTLKAKKIAESIEAKKLASIYDLSCALEHLTFLKQDTGKDPLVDDLINSLNSQLRLDSNSKMGAQQDHSNARAS